ncbi:MAG: RES family NAD+ phosphorylase [Thermoanaerobaculia bacterium]
MPQVWRIVKAAYARRAFDGEGARLYGGRWNSPGVRMVYTSDSLALAALELLTQLNEPSLLPSFVAIAAEIPDDAVRETKPGELPAHWRSHPAPPELQALGDAWARSRASLALRVPSAIVPRQSNFLLNPEHPDLAKLKTRRPEPFDFDLRLLRRDRSREP